MNIIVFDIGNTHIVIGYYNRDKLVDSWRIRTDKTKTEDEYFVILRNLLSTNNINLPKFDKFAVSSVVPTLTRVFIHLSEKYFQKEAFVVTAYTNLGIKFPIEDPGFVGSDLVVNAYSAIKKYKTNCIICDLGTATTIQLIGADGYFYGTSILPGMMTSASSLFDIASQLSNIQLYNPKKILGLNTQDALNSGIVKGHKIMVEGIVKQLKNEYSRLEIKVIATGGIASLVFDQSSEIDIIDKTLLLDGLFLISQK
ncbi:MAG: type III pantothenate kinase [Candidatus Cloacimonadota bacterium]|nr:type III pantothenate kinase [Candidatus Cloacimonadota bacterium]